MGTTNKIKYGLSNAHYAVATIAANGSATYATPVALPGSVSMSLGAEGDITEEWADDILWAELNESNGYSGDLELEIVPDSFLKDVLGYKEDANGILYEDADAPVVHFALLYEFSGDVHKTRRVLYNCVSKRPAEGSKTKTRNIEVQHETLSLVATSIYNASVNKNVPKAKAVPTDLEYNGWYSAVYQPTAVAATT